MKKKYIILIATAVLLLIALTVTYFVLSSNYLILLNRTTLSEKVGFDLTDADIKEIASKETENGHELCIVLNQSPDEFFAKTEVQRALSELPTDEDELFSEKLYAYIAMRTAFSAQFNISMQYVTHYCYVDVPNVSGGTSRIYWYSTDYEGEHLVFLYTTDIGKKVLNLVK